MGWDYNLHPQSKEGFIKDLLKVSDPELFEILDYSVRGNNLWVLYGITEKKKQSLTPEQQAQMGVGPFITLFRLACNQGCWGSKSMDEVDGPYYYDCPLKFLKKAPEPPSGYHLNHGGSGSTWRDKVREHHASKSKAKNSRPKVGQKIELPENLYSNGYAGIYTVTSDYGRKGLQLSGYLRIPNRQLKYVKIVES